MPVGVFPLQDRLERLNAGVGEQNIEPAKGGARPRGRGAQRRKIALVERGLAPALARRFDQTPGFGELVRCGRHNLKCRADRPGDVDAHDVGTLAREGDRDRAADPARCTGDDSGFAR